MDISGDARVHKRKIVIAGDNAAFLYEMISLLGAEFDIVATVEDGGIALAKTLRHRPDVVVLDLEMPFLNAIETTRELRKVTLVPAIVICSVGSKRKLLRRPGKLPGWGTFSKRA